MTALGGKSNSFIAGRTLMRMADSVKLLLRKIEPLAEQCMNKDGSNPSGQNKKDFLKKLIDRIIEEKAKGQFKDDDEVVDNEDNNGPSAVVTLTQGEALAAEAAQKTKESEWTHKFIPIVGWFAIALFCKHGLARNDSMENKLPLLKSGDYSKNEKSKHSRSSVRGEQRDAKGRTTAGRGNLSTGGYTAQEHLLASVVSLMADTNDAASKTDTICNKRDQLRLLQGELKHFEWRIDRYIQTGRDVDRLFVEYEEMAQHCRDLRTELYEIIAKEEKKRASDETTETARKVARLVQSQPPNGIIPSQIGNDIATKVSALHSEMEVLKTTELNTHTEQKETPTKDFAIEVGDASFDTPLATQPPDVLE